VILNSLIDKDNKMKEIYVNLKRFEVSRDLGGLCPTNHPTQWIQEVIADSIEMGLGKKDQLLLVYLLPEGLIPTAVNELKRHPENEISMIAIGCQSVHWDDIRLDGNFGAFTSSLPATSAKALGSTWAIIGHSEERRAKYQIIKTYDPKIETDKAKASLAAHSVDHLIEKEVKCALQANLNVLLCVGESAQERGEGSFEEQKPRIEEVLKSQLTSALGDTQKYMNGRKVVIGYEPIWAIGPGKTPPGETYISFVSAYIKEVLYSDLGISCSVVYGGGLKEENAAMIAGIKTIDGGLVALTRFTGEIGFDVAGLKGIIDKYLA
jgi:triosephosphate isomerase